MKIFSVDAETDGLYGPVWAIGAVVADGHGAGGVFSGMIDPDVVTDPWVRENIVPVVDDLYLYDSRDALLEAFWAFWMEYKKGAMCIADFGAPVEAGLFRACIERDLPNRQWEGPYPLHELGTLFWTQGINPDFDRREFVNRPDLVKHNPLDDAVVAAYCWTQLTATPYDGTTV